MAGKVLHSKTDGGRWNFNSATFVPDTFKFDTFQPTFKCKKTCSRRRRRHCYRCHRRRRRRRRHQRRGMKQKPSKMQKLRIKNKRFIHPFKAFVQQQQWQRQTFAYLWALPCISQQHRVMWAAAKLSVKRSPPATQPTHFTPLPPTPHLLPFPRQWSKINFPNCVGASLIWPQEDVGSGKKWLMIQRKH